MIDSVPAAIAVLKNPREREIEREHAIQYLKANPTPEAMEALVAAMGAADYGVHWTASEAVAFLGDDAMPALLRALAAGHADRHLLDGARHVFTHSTSAAVRERGQAVIESMKGAGSEFAVIQAASRWLAEIPTA